MRINPLTLLVLVVIAFLAVRGCEQVEPGPGPDRTTVEDVAAEQMRVFAQLTAEELEKSAASPVPDSVAHGTRLTAAIDRAYDAAFAPINELAEQRLGGIDPDTDRPRYTPAAAREFDAAVARGYRKALQ